MKHVRIWGLLALIALIISLPLVVGDPTFTSIGVYVLLFTCAAVAWNLFSGFTGYISLGEGVYFGVGAYTLALLCQRYSVPGGIGPFLLMTLSGLVASLFTVPIGWIALHTRSYKLFAYILSAFFIGMVGAQTVYYSGIVYPSYAFNVNFDVSVAVIAFVGGIGTVFGPIVGGFLIGPLQQYLNLQFSSIAAGFELVLSGAILLVIVLLMPEGIVPSLSKYWKMWKTIYNRKYSKEKLLPAFNTPKETSMVHVIPITPEETFVQNTFIEQPFNQVVLNKWQREINQK